MTYLFDLFIPAGTQVLRHDSTIVETRCPCYVDGAVRESDGGFTYAIGQDCFYASAGTVTVRPTSNLRSVQARMAHS